MDLNESSSNFPDALPEGEMVGHYRLEKPLGQGGFGITYRAFDTNLKRIVAIKEYYAEGLSRRLDSNQIVALSSKTEKDFKWGLDRFSDEARTLAQLRHPNIVMVHLLLNAIHDNAYFVMDFVPGDTMEGSIAKLGLPAATEVKSIFRQLLDGCEAIHKVNIVHRDIKPLNILMRTVDTDDVSSQGDESKGGWKGLTPVLIDFGASRHLAAQARGSRFSALVSDLYSPPEQYSRETQGAASDIYALAATMYYLITGQEPPPALPHATISLPVSAERSAELGNDFLNGLFKGLAYDINQRPQSIAQWRALLGDLDPQPVLSSPAPFTWSRRNLIMAGGVAGGLAVAGSLGGLAGIAMTHKGMNGSTQALSIGWTKTFGALSSDAFGQIVATPTGAVVAAHKMTEAGDHMLALRLTDAGDLTGEWEDTVLGGQAHAILPMADGGVYLGGTVGGNQAVVVRLDAQWKEVWRKPVGDGVVRSLLDKKGLIVVGIETEGSATPLVALDESGTIKWSRDMSKGAKENIERIVVLSTGNLAVLGSSYARGEGADGQSVAENSSWVEIVDDSGRNRSRADLQGLGTSFPLSIAEAGKQIYVCGFTFDGKATSPKGLFLWALNLDGGTVWQNWNYDHPTAGLALAADSDQRLYVAGYKGDPRTMWFAQVSDGGNLSWQAQHAYDQSGDTYVAGLSLKKPGDGFALGSHKVSETEGRLLITRIAG